MSETLRMVRRQIVARALAQAASDLDLAAATLKELRDAAVPNSHDKAFYRGVTEQADLLAADTKALVRRMPGLPGR